MEKLDAKTRRKAIKISLWEGLFGSFYLNLAGGMFAVGFIQTLGAKNIHYAWLTALPTIASIIQIFSAYWLQSHRKRKPFTIITTLLNRIFWIPVLILPFFLVKETALMWFFVIYAFICVLGTISNNAWTGWMADLIPASIRGRYFSRRALITTIVSVFIVLIAGVMLERFKIIPLSSIPGWVKKIIPYSGNILASEYVMFIGFGLIFAVAIINGIIGVFFLGAQKEQPAAIYTEKKKLNFHMIYECLQHKPFFKFIVFMVAWCIINGISVPFWMPYILDHLKMGYDTVGVLNIFGGIARVLSLLFWGKVVDRFGAKPVLFATIYIGSFHPLYYIVSTSDFTTLVYIDFISSGIIWAGVDIASLKMLFGNVPDKGKEMYYAIYATITGLAVSFPQFLAGAFADKVSTVGLFGVHLSSIQFIFLLVTIGRFASLGIVRYLDEPAAKPFNDMLRSLHGLFKEIFFLNFIRSGKK